MDTSVNEHYRRLLQLPTPWRVTAVEEDLLGQRVTIRLAWPDGTPAVCPVCGSHAASTTGWRSAAPTT